MTPPRSPRRIPTTSSVERRTSMTGFLLVDKPSGITSHDVVARVRRAAGVKRVGHAGTLDPLATGLLVVAVGPVTRLISHIQGAEKEYVADVMFGVGTDTLDADGEEIHRVAMPMEAAALEGVLGGFRGPITQVPPMVSAIKHQGVRLHELARRGEEVEREARPVTITALEVEAFVPGDFPTARLRVVCSTGTYIRVLADDIARALGGRAHLTGLRRTRIGTMTVADAATLGTLDDGVVGHLIDPADALDMYPSVTVDADTAAAVTNGRAVAGTAVGLVRVLDGDGRLLALYRGDGSTLRAETVITR